MTETAHRHADAQVRKTYSPKQTPNIVTYKKYTHFDKDKLVY